MQRTLMQVFVKNSRQALALYRQAFDATILCEYPNNGGDDPTDTIGTQCANGYLHAELDAYGQVIALSELHEAVQPGNTMMFCFHFGSGGGEKVMKAYDILKDGATVVTPPGPCEYSPCQCVLTDRFGVTWCLFE